MKKFLAIFVISLFLAFSSFTAEAAVVNGVNDSSIATSLATWLISVLMTNNNNAGISNSVTSTSNSGANTFTSADDQSGTSITTGDTAAASLVQNNANNNLVNEEYESSNGANNTIQNIDDGSEATTESEDTLENEIVNNNYVTVSNTVNADADSGSNAVVSGDSLVGSSALTGAAESATGVTNAFNLNIKNIVRRIQSLIP